MAVPAPSNLFLEKIVSSRRPSHAYLFFGPPSPERESTARAFVKALLCGKKQSAACGECPACRKFESGNHPDFTVVAEEEDRIKIAEMRQVKEASRYAPLEADWKITLIPSAERFTEEAAQSILKLFEDPPPRTLFILTATHPSSLPATVVSRCQKIPLMETHEANLAESPLFAEAAPVLFSEIRDPLDLFEKVSVLEDCKESGEDLLCFLFAFYRDVSVLKAGWPEGIRLGAYKDRAALLAEALSWPSLWAKSQAIREARIHLAHSGNFRLVLENLLWKLREN